MVYTLRFFSSSKCSLFHNSNVFGSSIIHILYTECAKIKKIIPVTKGYKLSNEMQRKAVYLLFYKFTLHVSSVNHTHHQEYTKM